jgi:hypothetical protein
MSSGIQINNNDNVNENDKDITNLERWCEKEEENEIINYDNQFDWIYSKKGDEKDYDINIDIDENNNKLGDIKNKKKLKNAKNHNSSNNNNNSQKKPNSTSIINELSNKKPEEFISKHFTGWKLVKNIEQYTLKSQINLFLTSDEQNELLLHITGITDYNNPSKLFDLTLIIGIQKLIQYFSTEDSLKHVHQLLCTYKTQPLRGNEIKSYIERIAKDDCNINFNNNFPQLRNYIYAVFFGCIEIDYRQFSNSGFENMNEFVNYYNEIFAKQTIKNKDNKIISKNMFIEFGKSINTCEIWYSLVRFAMLTNLFITFIHPYRNKDLCTLSMAILSHQSGKIFNTGSRMSKQLHRLYKVFISMQQKYEDKELLQSSNIKRSKKSILANPHNCLDIFEDDKRVITTSSINEKNILLSSLSSLSTSTTSSSRSSPTSSSSISATAPSNSIIYMNMKITNDSLDDELSDSGVDYDESGSISIDLDDDDIVIQKNNNNKRISEISDDSCNYGDCLDIFSQLDESNAPLVIPSKTCSGIENLSNSNSYENEQDFDQLFLSIFEFAERVEEQDESPLFDCDFFHNLSKEKIEVCNSKLDSDEESKCEDLNYYHNQSSSYIPTEISMKLTSSKRYHNDIYNRTDNRYIDDYSDLVKNAKIL